MPLNIFRSPSRAHALFLALALARSLGANNLQMLRLIALLVFFGRIENANRVELLRTVSAQDDCLYKLGNLLGDENYDEDDAGKHVRVDNNGRATCECSRDPRFSILTGFAASAPRVCHRSVRANL